MDPVETIINLYPTPEERWDLVEILRRLHPADVVTFLEHLLPVSPAPAPQTQPGPLRRWSPYSD